MKRLIRLISSPVLMAICLAVFAVSLAVATFIENKYGTPIARLYFYNAKWFEILLAIGSVNLLASIFTRKLYQKEKFSIFLFHIALVIIITGAGITRYFGLEGTMQIRIGESSDIITLNTGNNKTLPFTLSLTDFNIDYYPGSENPSGYESKVKLTDSERGVCKDVRIYMNNILKYRGYRFFQSSYHQDKSGTILSVSKDSMGTTTTYIGYFLLALGMAWSLVNKNSRFYNLIKNKAILALLILFSIGNIVFSQSTDTLPIIPKEHAGKFGGILVRDFQGRTKPISTLTSDILRKVNRKTTYKNQDATQVLLGMLVYPEKWQNVKIVYVGKLASETLNLDNEYTSLYKCYSGQGTFISSRFAWEASQKQLSERTKTESAIIKADERLNIIYHWFMGNMLNIYPVPDDTSGKWLNPITVQNNIQTNDSTFVENVFSMYLSEVKNSVKSGDWSMPDKLIDAIKRYQYKYGESLPSSKKVRLEQWYYKTDIYKYITYLYLLFGLIILAFQLREILSGKQRLGILSFLFAGVIGGAFLMHSFGMGIRWYISGHAPWSNSYESMLFIAWAAALVGLIFVRKSTIITALASVMASIFLIVAHMSWMDPQITNLPPVLKSIWLVIHVAIIMLGYGFLGVGSLIALINLLLMNFQSRNNMQRLSASINQFSRIIGIALIIGLYLLTIGAFLGGVWANISWGRYWGWDPKETWALITIIIYAFVLHMRLITNMNGQVLFNACTLVAYTSVLMTYFGVNYYLSGMHSYASGDAAPLPHLVYYIFGILILILIGAAFNTKRLQKSKI